MKSRILKSKAGGTATWSIDGSPRIDIDCQIPDKTPFESKHKRRDTLESTSEEALILVAPPNYP